MAYLPIVPQRLIEITQMFSVHYFEYTSSYRFSGESHDFWELLYVDNGAVQVVAGEETHNLSRGQMIFHQPGEFHALSANGAVAPNLVVVSFQCRSPAMDFFRRRILFAGAVERTLLARVVEESGEAFSTPLNDPNTQTLVRRSGGAEGSEQLLVMALEELLVRLIRQGERLPDPRRSRLSQVDGLPAAIAEYLEQRLDQPLTVEQVCRDNMIGRSQLQKLFHQQTGGGVMEYFGRMKIKAARQMIRDGHLNFTQIAEKLGFQSVHYFSRRFRAITGMSPSEYADSVKMLAEASQSLSDNRTNNV